jgi:hypothetical protein
VNDLGRGKAVEVRAAGCRISADVLAVEVVPQIHVGQLLRETDRVERVPGRTEHGADLQRSLLEAIEMILAVIEDDAAVRVADAVIEIVTEFAGANRLADDLRDGGRRRGEDD